jgi:hypothetical protein
MFTLGEIDQFVQSRIIGLIIRGTCGRKEDEGAALDGFVVVQL